MVLISYDVSTVSASGKTRLRKVAKERQNHAQRVQNSVFEADLDFHELDSWSSLTSLGVVAMVYREYGVELDTQDVRNAETIEALFNIVKERKA